MQSPRSAMLLSTRFNMRRNTYAYQTMPIARFSPTPLSVEEERAFLMTRLHTLQAKVLTSNLRIPSSFRAKLEAFDANELNAFGEPLLIAVIKYLESKEDRMKYLKLLLDNGANVNAQDMRDKRTALMYACIEDSRTDEGHLLMNTRGCNFKLQDRLGNTALMYAAMKGRDELMIGMINELSKGWGLSALQMKNCMGNTAEDLAIRNSHHRCARLVQAQAKRLHMLSCLNRQMDMAGRLGSRQWCAFTTLYKCVDKWKPRQRRKSVDARFLTVHQQRERKASM
ncbi:Ankyrin repeat domain-containing protein 34B [Toxocara canis]|uniref:Ankyrin repeat domain-containing protein 34B n=1 Tax=Toxocara canis TaxID=6265 RepID=A0A0B2V7M1_TOXCA|nr:Ankyrin repeat domain-containing protein 34B [Toxocara canis]